MLDFIVTEFPQRIYGLRNSLSLTAFQLSCSCYKVRRSVSFCCCLFSALNVHKIAFSLILQNITTMVGCKLTRQWRIVNKVSFPLPAIGKYCGLEKLQLLFTDKLQLTMCILMFIWQLSLYSLALSASHPLLSLTHYTLLYFLKGASLSL